MMNVTLELLIIGFIIEILVIKYHFYYNEKMNKNYHACSDKKNDI